MARLNLNAPPSVQPKKVLNPGHEDTKSFPGLGDLLDSLPLPASPVKKQEYNNDSDDDDFSPPPVTTSKPKLRRLIRGADRARPATPPSEASDSEAEMRLPKMPPSSRAPVIDISSEEEEEDEDEEPPSQVPPSTRKKVQVAVPRGQWKWNASSEVEGEEDSDDSFVVSDDASISIHESSDELPSEPEEESDIEIQQTRKNNFHSDNEEQGIESDSFLEEQDDELPHTPSPEPPRLLFHGSRFLDEESPQRSPWPSPAKRFQPPPTPHQKLNMDTSRSIFNNHQGTTSSTTNISDISKHLAQIDLSSSPPTFPKIPPTRTPSPPTKPILKPMVSLPTKSLLTMPPPSKTPLRGRMLTTSSTTPPSTSPSPPPKTPGTYTLPTASDLATRRAFLKTRESTALHLLSLLDSRLTNGRITTLFTPLGGLPIIWTTKLRSTAGRAFVRTKKTPSGTPETTSGYIELSTKILDRPQRLYNTLSHEFCHIIVMALHHEFKNHHGKLWRSYAEMAEEKMEDYGVKIDCRHSYEIERKYHWTCQTEGCGWVYRKDTKSIDPMRHRCSQCNVGKGGGVLVQTKPKPRAAGEYACFVKANMARIKKENPGVPHREIMGLVGKEWRRFKEMREVEEGVENVPVGGRGEGEGAGKVEMLVPSSGDEEETKMVKKVAGKKKIEVVLPSSEEDDCSAKEEDSLVERKFIDLTV